MNDLDGAVDWLKTSPMQRMSLGSRELFHSDFLSWLFETYPTALGPVFGLHLNGCKVEREKQNLDLVVRETHTSPPVLIIENKMKSYPDREQLERYNAKFPETKKRVLLTLVAPSFDMPDWWEILLYRELADQLRGWFSGANVAAEHRQYVEDYVAFIGHLSTVAEACFAPLKIQETNFWFEKTWEQQLSEIGFAQTLQKFQAVAFRDFLLEAVPRASGADTPRLLVQDGGTNDGEDHIRVWLALFKNTPCVTFVPTLAKPDLGGLRFEIQIQGRQYRRLMAGPSLTDFVKEKKALSDSSADGQCLADNGSERWLFGRVSQQGPRGKKGFELNGSWKRSSMRGDMCFYKPDTLYQYLDISVNGELGALSLDELPAQIALDIELAFELLKAPK